jgi:acetyl-CoA carboxylase beta subunit
LLEHGFLDYIIDRTEIRNKLALSLKLFSWYFIISAF